MTTEPTTPTAQAGAIDVVAVMRAAFDALPVYEAAPMYEAIVAVEELFNDVRSVIEYEGDPRFPHAILADNKKILDAALHRTGATK